MPDVFQLLNDDHRKVERLFAQFESSQDQAVARQICDELTVHAMVEEELVYPLLASKVGTGLATEAREEHQEAKDLVNQIEQGMRSGGDIAPVVAKLKEGVQHHVQEEEGEVWPKMREKIPQLVSEMGDEVVARKAELMDQVAQARSLGEPAGVVGSNPSKARPS